MSASKFKLALIQLKVGVDKAANIQRAISKITEAVNNGANMVVLPECFNTPYGHQYFKPYAEKVPGSSTDQLSAVAKQHKVYLIGGSIPEEENGIIFNTCPIFNRTGSMVAAFRKMHLFDIDVPGKMTFKESDSMKPGKQPVIFQTEYCKVGVGICYDVRFGELAQLYALNGCNLLVYPGAFNMTTGPAHWELMAKSRATQTQTYVALCSPARDTSAGYVAWGHSVIVDPWGSIVAAADENETIIYADIDMDRVKEVRQMIPITTQRRKDVYDTVAHVKPLVVE